MRKKIDIPNDINGKAGNTYFLHVVPSSYSNSTYYNIEEEYAVNVNGIPSFVCRILKIKTVSELSDATTLLSHGMLVNEFINKFYKPQYYILLCKRIK